MLNMYRLSLIAACAIDILQAQCAGDCISRRIDCYTPDSSVKPFSFMYVPNAHWFSFNPSTNHGMHRREYKMASSSVAFDGTLTLPFYHVKSIGECAALTSLHNQTFFSFVSTTETCVAHIFGSNVSTLNLLTPQGSYVQQSAALSPAFQRNPPPPQIPNSIDECSLLCLKQLTCAAFTWDNFSCRMYAPISTVVPNSFAGWVTDPVLPMQSVNQPTFSTAKSVHFYFTAHQDDHELFMANVLHWSIRNPETKVVFFYITAGDSTLGDSWRKAREDGTLAASIAWVEHFGMYSATPLVEVVNISNVSSGIIHKIQKVTVGNCVHYFLRISEPNFNLLNANQGQVAPMDDPLTPYRNRNEFKDVLTQLFSHEVQNIPSIEVNAPVFNSTEIEDHWMHRETGRLANEIVVENSNWNDCVTRRFYYGYQHWGDFINLKSPVLEIQRYLWMRISQAIYALNSNLVFWSEHSNNLGRTYIQSINYAASTTCP